jgi:hypothetical protein
MSPAVLVAVRQDAVARQRGGARCLTGTYPGYQDFGVGLAGKFDELGAQVLLQGSSGQRRAGGEFVASLIGNVSHCDGCTHSIIMQLMLLKCNLAGVGQERQPRGSPRPVRLKILIRPGRIRAVGQVSALRRPRSTGVATFSAAFLGSISPTHTVTAPCSAAGLAARQACALSGPAAPGTRPGTTLHQLPQIPGGSDFLPKFLPKQVTQRSRNVIYPGHSRKLAWPSTLCYQPSKLVMRIRFPSPALDQSRQQSLNRQLRRQLRRLPSGDVHDPGFCRLRYSRYADHILGFTGPKAEAEALKAQLAAFLRDEPAFELNVAKTLVTHAPHPGSTVSRLRDHRPARRPEDHRRQACRRQEDRIARAAGCDQGPSAPRRSRHHMDLRGPSS